MSHLYEDIKTSLVPFRFNDRLVEETLLENNTFIEQTKVSSKNFLKDSLSTDTTETFITKLYTFFKICDIDSLSKLLEFSEVSSFLVHLAVTKPLLLVVGSYTFIGIFNKYCEETEFLSSILKNIRQTLVYKKVGLYMQRTLTDRRVVYAISFASIAFFVYNANKNQLEVTEAPLLPEENKTSSLPLINKDALAEQIKSKVDPVMITGDPGMFLEAVRISLSRCGYVAGQLIGAPMQCFYIGMFKPVIDEVLKFLNDKKDE
jgi:hypothetical protein